MKLFLDGERFELAVLNPANIIGPVTCGGMEASSYEVGFELMTIMSKSILSSGFSYYSISFSSSSFQFQF